MLYTVCSVTFIKNRVLSLRQGRAVEKDQEGQQKGKALWKQSLWDVELWFWYNALPAPCMPRQCYTPIWMFYSVKKKNFTLIVLLTNWLTDLSVINGICLIFTSLINKPLIEWHCCHACKMPFYPIFYLWINPNNRPLLFITMNQLYVSIENSSWFYTLFSFLSCHKLDLFFKAGNYIWSLCLLIAAICVDLNVVLVHCFCHFCHLYQNSVKAKQETMHEPIVGCNVQ